MAGIKHLFTSATPDSTNPALVNPSNWNAVHDIPATGIQIGDAATNEMTAVAASAGASGGLQYLRRNVTNSAYEFVAPLVAPAADYNWSQTPGGSLTVGSNAITLTPVPLGVSGTNVGHRVYISGGTGTAEPVVITGGTAVSGAATGTLIFTAVNTHTGAWTASSASFGLQEAINVVGVAGGGTIRLPTGTSTLLGTVTITYNNITIEGTGGSCCGFGSTIQRTGDFGDSIVAGTSASLIGMLTLSDFAMTQVINYQYGNPGMISNKPTSGAHIRLWGTNTANINRMRFENMVQNVVMTGVANVVLADSTFLGLWNPASATVQVTEASVLVNQAASGSGINIPSHIALLNNLFFGYLTSSPGYTNGGPRQSVDIVAAEDLIIDGGSMGGSSVNNVRLSATTPYIVMNVRIVNVKFDSTNAADVEFISDGVAKSNNVLISNNIFNGENVGANGILVTDPGSGVPAVTGLVITGNNAMAYTKTPFMFYDGKGITVTGNSIRYYNYNNGYSSPADASAIYFGGRSDQALVTGNQLGGGQAYEAYGTEGGGNYCLFGISIALPLTTQNGVRLLGNYPAYWTALGTPYSGPVFSTTIPTIPGRAFKFSEPTVVGGSVSLASIDDQTGALIPSEFRSTDYNFVNGNVRVGTTTPTAGGTFEVQGGRSFFSAVNEAFGIGSKYSAAGGAVYFGATSASATPDAQISGSAGNVLITLLNNGNVGIGNPTPTASTLLDLTSTTGALLLPRMTTAQRNALTAINGMLIYNTTTAKFQGYEAGAWTNLI